MKQLFSICIGMAVAHAAIAKDDLALTIYKTYNDYTGGTGEQLHDFIGYDWTLGSLHLFYRIKKRDEGKVKVTSVWGFSIGDQLYRVISGRPYRVLMQGKAVYYENGIAHMNMLVENEGSSEVELGGWSFLSVNLTSEIIEFPSNEADRVFGNNEALLPLMECIRKLKKHKTEKIRTCVKEHI